MGRRNGQKSKSPLGEKMPKPLPSGVSACLLCGVLLVRSSWHQKGPRGVCFCDKDCSRAWHQLMERQAENSPEIMAMVREAVAYLEGKKVKA
jgi:hypothetical protein